MSELAPERLDEDSYDGTDVSLKTYATTKGGKDILIYVKHCYWNIKFSSGGQLPLKLKGRFTRYAEAAYAVDEYLRTEPTPKKPRATKN